MYRQKILVASEKTVLYSAALEVGPAQRQKQREQMLDEELALVPGRHCPGQGLPEAVKRAFG